MTNPTAVVVLIWRHGEPLMVSRRDHTAWGLPGGKVDPGETTVEAAVREVTEETGLRLVASDLLEVHRGEESGYLVVAYAAPDPGGKLAPKVGEAVAQFGDSRLLTGPDGSFRAYNAAVIAAYYQIMLTLAGQVERRLGVTPKVELSCKIASEAAGMIYLGHAEVRAYLANAPRMQPEERRVAAIQAFGHSFTNSPPFWGEAPCRYPDRAVDACRSASYAIGGRLRSAVLYAIRATGGPQTFMADLLAAVPRPEVPTVRERSARPPRRLTCDDLAAWEEAGALVMVEVRGDDVDVVRALVPVHDGLDRVEDRWTVPAHSEYPYPRRPRGLGRVTISAEIPDTSLPGILFAQTAVDDGSTCGRKPPNWRWENFR